MPYINSSSAVENGMRMDASNIFSLTDLQIFSSAEASVIFAISWLAQ